MKGQAESRERNRALPNSRSRPDARSPRARARADSASSRGSIFARVYLRPYDLEDNFRVLFPACYLRHAAVVDPIYHMRAEFGSVFRQRAT